MFALGVPLVIWSRVTLGAHTLPETLAGALVGAGFALLFLL
jgi:membrane-associated phospholipid phosphatase